jgi:hypothetical protein
MLAGIETLRVVSRANRSRRPSRPEQLAAHEARRAGEVVGLVGRGERRVAD